MLRWLALICLAMLLFTGCSQPQPTQSVTQEEVDKIMQLINGLYEGTSREGLITKVSYDGSTVTVYTEIFPDAEGVEIAKKMRVGIYTTLKSEVKVDKVVIVDKGGYKWIYP